VLHYPGIEVRGVQVFDMPTSVRFFRDVLGFEVVQTTRVANGMISHSFASKVGI